VGYSYYSSTIAKCYSIGPVEGSSNVGGLVGYKENSNTISISNCFWNTVTSGQSSSAGGTGKTTTEMLNQETFTDWNFTVYRPDWGMRSDVNDGYPQLEWAFPGYYYRSKASGQWNSSATWELSVDENNWVTGLSDTRPTCLRSGDGIKCTYIEIDIRSGHTVTNASEAELIPLTIVSSGGTLVVGINLTVKGPMEVFGTMTVNDYGIFVNAAGTLTCQPDSVVNFTGGAIPAPTNTNNNNITWHHLNISGSGSYFRGTATINGNLTISSGSALSVSSQSLNPILRIAGNWSNDGVFSPGYSTVSLIGTNQTISGDNEFYGLTKDLGIYEDSAADTLKKDLRGNEVSAADTLTFKAGSTTKVTSTLLLRGSEGNLLSLRSDIPGTQWKINFSTEPPTYISVQYLDVQDSNNIFTTAIDARNRGNRDSRNNVNWDFGEQPPIVTTQAVSNISTTTAMGNGNITYLGTTNPTAHGVCWSTSANPTIVDSKVDKGAASATGPFTADITGLAEGTTYHVRAYATNSAGTSYGSDVTFTTGVTPIILYYFYYTAGAHGSITGETFQIVTFGSDGRPVTAVPDINYRFVNWSDSSTANPRTDSFATSDISVTANFALNQYTLTYTAGAHGSITGTSSQTVNRGANGSAVTAVPESGYQFVSWSDGSTANPRTDTNVTANITVTATFALKQYTLTYTAGAHGSITGTSPQTVTHGANGSAVTATADTDYQFVNWSDGSTANPRMDTNVTANITVTANFSHRPIVITSSSGTGGTISPVGNVSVNYGDDQSFTITPNSGYKVSEVLVDSEKVTSISADGGIYTFTAVTESHTISAKFAVTVKFLGIWSDEVYNGVYVWEQKTNKWSRIPDTADATMIATGDVDGDSIDDLIGVWSSGLYVLKSTTGKWNLITQDLPTWITAGDMNNDGLVDIIGNWADAGVYCWDSAPTATQKWWKLASPARQLAAGKIGGIRDDLVWVQGNDLMVRYSADGSWKLIDSVTPIRWIAAGNMTGDSLADIIGSYSRYIWYWNSETNQWSQITTSAEQVAAGDIDGDGMDDLVGVWQSGVWIKYSKTGLWQRISSTKPVWITTGRVLVPENASGSVQDSYLSENVSELSAEGPEDQTHEIK
jgi:hypothetical protein